MRRMRRFNEGESRKNVVDGLEFIEIPMEEDEVEYRDIDNDKVKNEELYNIRIFLESSDDLIARDIYVFKSDIESFYKLFKKATNLYNLDWDVGVDTVKSDRSYYDGLNKFRDLMKKKSFLVSVNGNSEWAWTGKRFMIK